MAVELGIQPFPLEVTLPRDADFVAVLNRPDGWAAGESLELRLMPNTGDPIVWTAEFSDTYDAKGENVTVVNGTATFDVTATDVGVAIGAGVVNARLHYLDAGGNSLLWGKGRVRFA
jgi:hypothetical protein